PQETVGSLEMREVLSKQLEDVMAQNTSKAVGECDGSEHRLEDVMAQNTSKAVGGCDGSEHLEDVMAQNTGKRRRRGSKRLNCSGQVGTPEDSSASSGAKSRRTEERVAVVERNSAENQPSQSVHVVWDDPIRR
ncbi:hypothetical protein DPMN_079139, partial [Dreissena polymorpha]